VHISQQRIAQVFVLLGLICALAASAAFSQAPKKAAPAEVKVPFKVGETLTYDVSWSSYLTAGTVTLSVLNRHPSYGSIAYYIVGEARPTALMSTLYTLYYKADALVDVYTLLPQRASVYSEEGKRHLNKVTMFDQGAKEATFENTTAKDARREMAVPAYAQDALSAAYVLRALPLKAGAHTTIPVTTDGQLYRAEIYVDGLEALKTPAGPFQAWKLRAIPFNERGQTESRPLMLWISDTPSRVPVKLQADLPVGSFNLTLRELNLGGTPAAAR
jgi:hypothetical protein